MSPIVLKSSRGRERRARPARQYGRSHWRRNAALLGLCARGDQPQRAGEGAEGLAVAAGEAEAERRPARRRPDGEDRGEADRAVGPAGGEIHEDDPGEGDGEAEEELQIERGEPLGDLEL